MKKPSFNQRLESALAPTRKKRRSNKGAALKRSNPTGATSDPGSFSRAEFARTVKAVGPKIAARVFADGGGYPDAISQAVKELRNQRDELLARGRK